MKILIVNNTNLSSMQILHAEIKDKKVILEDDWYENKVYSYFDYAKESNRTVFMLTDDTNPVCITQMAYFDALDSIYHLKLFDGLAKSSYDYSFLTRRGKDTIKAYNHWHNDRLFVTGKTEEWLFDEYYRYNLIPNFKLTKFYNYFMFNLAIQKIQILAKWNRLDRNTRIQKNSLQSIRDMVTQFALRQRFKSVSVNINIVLELISNSSFKKYTMSEYEPKGWRKKRRDKNV